MHIIGPLSLHSNTWSTNGSLFLSCSGLGAPRKIYASWTSDLGDSVHSGDVSWIHIAFHMPMKFIPVLFHGFPSFKELLPSIFSSVWISSNLAKWHSRPWSGTWFRAQFLSNRLGVIQNGLKPTSQMAMFTPSHGQFSEFLNECGEILSGTDMVLPDLVLAVFWVVAQISAFWDGACPSVHV